MAVYRAPRKHVCKKIKPAFMFVLKTTPSQKKEKTSISGIHTDPRGLNRS